MRSGVLELSALGKAVQNNGSARPRCDAQYQQVDLGAPQLPVRAVERQDPGNLLGQQRGHGAGDVGLIKGELAKEALQPEIVRTGFGPVREHRSQAGQIHRAHLECQDPCNYVPKRSYTLFQAREALRTLRDELRTTKRLLPTTPSPT